MFDDNKHLDQIEISLYRLVSRAENEPSLQFVKQLKRHNPGIRIFLVGGVVRDEILGNDSTDYDLLVEGARQADIIEFLNLNGQILGGSDQSTGVYKFLPKGVNSVIDIALSRTEEYKTKSRKPTGVDIIDVSVKEDLSRRDFTINAIALEIFSNNELSYVGLDTAIYDIKHKIIRAVGDPNDRFNEDPLRILRTVRFACKLIFSIDKNTLNAMRKFSTTINQNYVDKKRNVKRRVSRERIQKEVSIGFQYNAVRFLNILDETNLLVEVFPEIDRLKGIIQSKKVHSEGDVFAHTMLVVSNLPNSSPIYLKLAGLYHDIGKFDTTKLDSNGRVSAYGHEIISGKETKLALKKMKYSNEFIDKVVWLVENHMRIYSFFEMSVSKRNKLATNPLFKDLIALAKADDLSSIRADGVSDMGFYDRIYDFLNTANNKLMLVDKTLINGNDVIACINKLGLSVHENRKHIGIIKEKINDLYCDGKLFTKKEACILIKSYFIDLNK